MLTMQPAAKEGSGHRDARIGSLPFLLPLGQMEEPLSSTSMHCPRLPSTHPSVHVPWLAHGTHAYIWLDGQTWWLMLIAAVLPLRSAPGICKILSSAVLLWLLHSVHVVELHCSNIHCASGKNTWNSSVQMQIFLLSQSCHEKWVRDKDQEDGQ